MKVKIQQLAVSLLALLVTAHAQSGPSKVEAKTRVSRFLPSLVLEKVASYFRSNRGGDSSDNDKTARSDSIPQVPMEDENVRPSARAESPRSSVLSLSVLNPIKSLYNKASSTIASVTSKIKNNLSSRISIPSAYLAASKKDDGITDGNSLANIIAKDISMNLEEEIQRNKKSNRYDHRKVTSIQPQKLDTKVKTKDTIKHDIQLQTTGEQISYANDKFSPKDLVTLNKVEEESDGYDPFYSINGADPEIVRHFDPDGDSTQFLYGEKREEPKSNPFAILYHLYSAWGEEAGEEKYDARGRHL